MLQGALVVKVSMWMTVLTVKLPSTSLLRPQNVSKIVEMDSISLLAISVTNAMKIVKLVNPVASTPVLLAN